MKFFQFFLIVSLLFVITSNAAFGLPAVRSRAQLSQRGKTLTLTLTPASTAAGCSYSVYGAATKRKLSTPTRGTFLTQQDGAESATTIVARNLKTLKRANSRDLVGVVFFRAVVTCGAETGMSNTAKLRIAKKTSGLLRISNWLKQIRARILVGNLSVVEAFPNISFSSPLELQNAGDGTNRLFVVEQGGKIYVISNDSSTSTKTLFLDISAKVEAGGERGLLGLAFHPNYSQNGFFYVHYSKSGSGDTMIARYSVQNGNPNAADPNSELPILEQTQPQANHNGGTITFGPDGFLYIALGDGGGGGDPDENGQNRATFLGKILRIDVNNTANGKNYAIPASNPLVGNGSGFKEEIFAWGMRNPWRCSFDEPTTRLWCADVGQNEWEEVDIIESGKNYGWNTMEGAHCYDPSSGCDTTGLELPIAEYSHSGDSRSVTGGYVYRGSKLPALQGLYVFGEFITGEIYVVEYSTKTMTRIFDTDINISSFGVDESGEIYFLNLSDGKIYKFQ